MPAPLPLPLRLLNGLATWAVRRKWLPTPRSRLETPHAERLKRKAMFIACKPGDPSILTQDVMVDGSGGPIHARVYTRPDTQPGAPAILFIHGGGFVECGIDFCDNVQRGLAARTGYVVVGLSYRLAPEHPFPAALDDCEDVLRWMVESKPAGLDPQRIAVGGESAGGNLTVALALTSRDKGGPAIRHLSIYYPFTDTTLTSPDWDTSDMPGVGRAEAEFMVSVYAPNDANNPLVSVLHADLARLPPSTVITCGHDPLRTDGVALAAALKAAGVPTLHTHYDEMPHGFLMFTRLTKRADESMDEMAREATKAFERATRMACVVLLALCMWWPATLYAAPTPAPVRAEIETLLAQLESSGCKFYRNGQWFSGPRAKQHLLSKLENAEKVATLDSTEDFIARVATKSSASGKPYRVRCATEESRPSAEWLTAELNALRTEAQLH